MNRATVRADLIAGITGAIVVLPQGVAFATIAGMPPEYGLYAAMVPAIVAALFGSSWHLVSGPTTAASIVLFASLSNIATPESPEYVKLALTLTLIVGLFEIVLGFARLGTIVNFISHSVVIGFTAGAAILIATKQIKNFFGVPIPRGLHPHDVYITLFQKIDQVNPYILGVALITLIVGILVKKYAKKIPYMVVAILAGSVAAFVLNSMYGKGMTGITTVKELPAVLPPLSLPDFRLDTIRQLVPIAFAATVLALTEAVSIARAIGARAGQNVDGNQEFIGQGLSNIVGSFFSSYVATGSFNRSGVNYEAGARTPLAATFAGFALMAIVLLVAPYATLLPDAAMAGVLFLVAWGLVDFQHIRHIFHTSRSESAVFSATFLGTLFLELEFAIMLGVFLSMVFYLSRTSRPRILSRLPDPSDSGRVFTTNPDLPECPQFKIIRIDGSVFFGAVNHITQALQGGDVVHPDQKHLMIVAKGVNFVDMAGAELLGKEAERRKKLGGGLYLYEVKRRVREALERAGSFDHIGNHNIFETKADALKTIVEDRLDHSLCHGCTKHVFLECARYASNGNGRVNGSHSSRVSQELVAASARNG